MEKTKTILLLFETFDKCDATGYNPSSCLIYRSTKDFLDYYTHFNKHPYRWIIARILLFSVTISEEEYNKICTFPIPSEDSSFSKLKDRLREDRVLFRNLSNLDWAKEVVSRLWDAEIEDIKLIYTHKKKNEENQDNSLIV